MHEKIMMIPFNPEDVRSALEQWRTRVDDRWLLRDNIKAKLKKGLTEDDPLWGYVSQLPERLLRILRGRWAKKTYREIGTELSVSGVRARDLYEQAERQIVSLVWEGSTRCPLCQGTGRVSEE